MDLKSLSDVDLRVELTSCTYRIADSLTELRHGVTDDVTADRIEERLALDESLLEHIKQEIARRFNR